MSQPIIKLSLAKWKAAGSPPDCPIDNEWRLMAFMCWITSDGAKKEGVIEEIAQYIEAAYHAMDAKYPNWYDDLLNKRWLCDGCGMTYRVENLATCTGCLASYCHACVYERFTRAPNGNHDHHCGGEFVG